MKYAIFVQCHVVNNLLVDHYRLFPTYSGARDVLVHVKRSTFGRGTDVDVFACNRSGTRIFRYNGNINGAIIRMGTVTEDGFFRMFNYKQIRTPGSAPKTD